MKQARIIPTLLTMAALMAGCAPEGHDGHGNGGTRSVHYTGPAADVTKMGEPVTLAGDRLEVGDAAPEARLITSDMREVNVSAWEGDVLVLSVAPSLDTPVCASQTAKLDRMARGWPRNVHVVSVSMDLPSALDRWAANHDIRNMVLASDYKHREFGPAYGLLMRENALLARAALVVDPAGTIRHIEVVGDLGREPDYQAIAEAVREIASD